LLSIYLANMANPDIYLPGSTPPTRPLDRYLPPIPAGVVSTWLAANIPKGSWVLDPFGATPQVAVEAAQAGYRVAVAANNPIARFLLETRVLAPSAEDFRAALAELASARRGDERLETAILDLYMTSCPKCGAQTPADAFIWDQVNAGPIAKMVNCKACGESGEYPTDEQDQERAATYSRGGPQLSRALERIAPKGDPDREHAEEALEAYLPRAVYALFTIINRVDGLTLDENQRRLISALVLSACDRATSLWAHHPGGRMRPKQLVAPAQFREYNLWYEMERSIELWAQDAAAIPLVMWPEVPPASGGISLFEGRFREMAEHLGKIKMAAVVTAFPRPNQAFWTLCALWAGWLWGREAIGPFALVLRRKRYDWAWHAEALHAGLAPLSEQLAVDTPLFGIVGESEPGFNTAAIAAANLADFRIDGMALRREEDQLQITWRKGIPSSTTSAEPTENVRRAAVKLLVARGEPSHFQQLQLAGLGELSKRTQLGSEISDPGELATETRSTFEVGLTFRGSFTRFGSSEQSLETGLWWLLDPASARSPLADRVEIAVVRYLLRRPGHSLDEVDRMLCKIFPGLLTPPRSLAEAILKSYGEEKDGRWSIASADQPKSRRADLRDMRTGLKLLGERLGYQIVDASPVEWRNGNERVQFSFFPIASALLGDVFLKSTTSPGKSLILLPGRRASLALYKIERDPRFKQAIADGWRFIKFRHLRRLAENKSLTNESFVELLELDPLTLEQAQAPLL
jgi:hypothetical protein